MAKMESLAPQWMRGCRLRGCWFEPTFHKHAGKLCAGIQIHVDDAAYDHDAFRPWRLFSLALKSLRTLRPDDDLWRDFPYEYERDRLAIDLINGSELLRQWVDTDVLFDSNGKYESRRANKLSRRRGLNQLPNADSFRPLRLLRKIPRHVPSSLRSA